MSIYILDNDIKTAVEYLDDDTLKQNIINIHYIFTLIFIPGMLDISKDDKDKFEEEWIKCNLFTEEARCSFYSFIDMCNWQSWVINSLSNYNYFLNFTKECLFDFEKRAKHDELDFLKTVNNNINCFFGNDSFIKYINFKFSNEPFNTIYSNDRSSFPIALDYLKNHDYLKYFDEKEKKDFIQLFEISLLRKSYIKNILFEKFGNLKWSNVTGIPKWIKESFGYNVDFEVRDGINKISFIPVSICKK